MASGNLSKISAAFSRMTSSCDLVIPLQGTYRGDNWGATTCIGIRVALTHRLLLEIPLHGGDAAAAVTLTSSALPSAAHGGHTAQETQCLGDRR